MKETIERVLELLERYEGPAYVEPVKPEGYDELAKLMEPLAARFDAFLGVKGDSREECEAKDRRRATDYRLYRAKGLASADLWIGATETNTRCGHGDSFDELIIKREGAYGSGEFPKVFDDLEAALKWSSEFKYTKPVIVPLRRAE